MKQKPSDRVMGGWETFGSVSPVDGNFLHVRPNGVDAERRFSQAAPRASAGAELLEPLSAADDSQRAPLER